MKVVEKVEAAKGKPLPKARRLFDKSEHPSNGNEPQLATRTQGVLKAPKETLLLVKSESR